MNTPQYPFTVVVVGDSKVMTTGELERLLAVLVNRHTDTRRIVLICDGSSSGPELRWCQDRGWSLHVIPTCREPVRRDCNMVVQADAVVILGDTRPWRRLIALCAEARIPTRVYYSCPALPPSREHPAEG